MFYSTLFALAGFVGSVYAADYDLKDQRILGLYKLVKPDKKSDVKTAELIYNTDNKLVVVTSEDLEYELSASMDSDFVYEGNDEPNCGGEEQKCWYDSHTVIQLKKVNMNGRDVPQLTIQITKSNAWDDQGTDDYTSTYVLNWNRSLDYAIPYYVNIQPPSELKALADHCKRELKDLESEEGAQYLGENDICPSPYSVQLREPVDKALNFLFKDLLSFRNKPEVRKLTATELKTQVFNKARRLAERYKPERKSSPARKDILAQIDRIEAYAVRADEIYTYPYLRDAVIVMVDTQNKVVSHFNIRTELKYRD